MTQQQLHDRLEQIGWWRPFEDLDQSAFKPEEPPKPIGRPKKQKPPNDLFRRNRLRSAGKNQTQYEREFKQGKKAFHAGEKRKSNPFNLNSLSWQLWYEGFDFAESGERSMAEFIMRKKR